MRLIIVTRSGIGIARRSFYRQRAALLRAGLQKSLVNQGNQKFEWVLAVDCNIDDESRQEFLALVEGHPNFRLLLVDPIARRQMHPPTEDVIGPEASGLIAMARVDDDDLLHRDWVTTMRAALREHGSGTLPFSAAIEHGIDLLSMQRSFRHYHHPTTPVGITLVSPASNCLNVFFCNHNRLHKMVEQMGGASRIVETRTPMWIYVRHAESESSPELVDIIKNHIFRQIDGKMHREMRIAFQRCGVAETWCDDIVRIYAEHDDPKTPLIVGPHPRMGLKRELLKILGEKPDDVKRTKVVKAFLYTV